MTRKNKIYIYQFLSTLLISFLYTIAKDFKLIPHSVRLPKYYSYETLGDFLISFLGVWGILGFSIIWINKSYSKKTQVICSKCEYTEEVSKKDSYQEKCPKCGAKMNKLEGFYSKRNKSE